MKTWFNIRHQDGASTNTEKFIFVHDHVHIIMLIIITPEIYLIIILIQNKHASRFILEGKIIDTTWTVAPAVNLLYTLQHNPFEYYASKENFPNTQGRFCPRPLPHVITQVMPNIMHFYNKSWLYIQLYRIVDQT